MKPGATALTLMWKGPSSRARVLVREMMAPLAVERGLQVDVQDEVPDLVVHVVEGLVPGDAGVVDQDVDLAELVRGRIHHPAGLLHVHRVVGRDQHLAAGVLDGLGRLFSRLGIDVVHHDGRALLGEQLRRGRSDPPAGAGDDGDLPVQTTQGSLLRTRGGRASPPRA